MSIGSPSRRRLPGAAVALAAAVSCAPPPDDAVVPDPVPQPETQALTEVGAASFAALALDCVLKEYPNQISLRLESDADLAPPRELTPVFYGCYDWHSAVHGHWLLARLTRRFPDAGFAAAAREALAHNFTGERVAGELAYVSVEGRRGFERPYGLAWLLQLDAELVEWAGDPAAGAGDRSRAARWREILRPLVDSAVERLSDFLARLEHPIRVGEHRQTAFSVGLIHDWAVSTGHAPMAELLAARAAVWYREDVACPLVYEPAGQDFLSPCLGEADFMRRVLSPNDFTGWLDVFLPWPLPDTLEPVDVPDDEEDSFGHLHGLHLSRAWMLRGIAFALPDSDPRRPVLAALAARNAAAGLAGVDPSNYTGSHWLGSFAVYLLTDRGLPAGGGQE